MFDLSLLALEGYDASVVVTSITLVFGVLVLLCLIITLEGKFFAARDKKALDAGEAAKAATAAKAAAAPAVPAPAAAAAPAPAAPAPDGAIPGEIVAAITAAVTCLEGENVTVHSIRRAPAASRRGVWGDAGVLQNTRPFI